MNTKVVIRVRNGDDAPASVERLVVDSRAEVGAGVTPMPLSDMLAPAGRFVPCDRCGDQEGGAVSIELVAKAKKTRLHGDSTAKLLLIVLADYANDEGMAWPSVKTMAEETEKSERSIQLLLRKLEQMRLIRKGDQKLVAKYAKGRRPVVYKLFPKTKKGETPNGRNG